MATRPLARTIDQRQQQVRADQELEGGVVTVIGEVEIMGTGEAHVDVRFPVRFLERPVFAGGYSLGDNQTWVEGSAATGIATVLKWDFGNTPTGNERYYDGAHIAFLVTGAAGDQQKGVGSYMFMGNALVGPAGR